MTYALPPIAMAVVYVAMACLVIGFLAAIAGLAMAIPRLAGAGGKTFGERAYLANQRHGEFYRSPEFKRERLLCFWGFGTFGLSFAFILFVMLTFGVPISGQA